MWRPGPKGPVPKPKLYLRFNHVTHSHDIHTQCREINLESLFCNISMLQCNMSDGSS